VVADKTPEAYAKLCNRFCIDIRELLMVGNSFKSDVEPVLQLGGYAVHIPFEYMWAHEHAETYEHPQLKTITHFSELLSLLGINSDTEYI
jgi:putative hydrolase of the HAD superfamily